MKKIISFGLALTMMVSLSIPSFAAEIASEEITYQITLDGVVYTVNESFYGDEKVVKVTGAGNETVVTLDDEELVIYGDHAATTLSVDELESEYDQIETRATAWASKTSLFWNYYYYYSDGNFATKGMYFSFKCGDNGSWSGFDKKNTEARNLGYEYCAAVRELDSAQVTAVAAAATSAASIAAAIASAGPTAGVGTIVGIVAAFVSGGVAVAEWVAAWNASLNCNQLFLQFKQTV